MTGLEIALFVLGAAFIVISFFIIDSNEAVAKSPSENDVSRETIRRISADAIEDINRKSDTIVAESEDRLEAISNDKIIAVGEYSDQVIEKINSNHKEVVFLYQMLNDKEEELKSTALKLDNIRIECEKLIKSEVALEVQRSNDNAAEAAQGRLYNRTIEPEPVINDPAAESLKQALKEAEARMNAEGDAGNDNDRPIVKAPVKAENRTEAGVSKTEPQPRPKTQPDVKPEIKPDVKPDVKPEAESKAVTQAKTAPVKTEPKPAPVKSEPKPAPVKSEPKPVKTDDKPVNTKQAQAADAKEKAMEEARIRARAAARERAEAQARAQMGNVSLQQTQAVKQPAQVAQAVQVSQAVQGTPAAQAPQIVQDASKTQPVRDGRVKRQTASMEAEGRDNRSLSRNEEIIALHKQGKTVMEISKLLSMGQGEVRLIINLYG
ncbi:MAG: hypothetical protein K6G81_10170 [Lachnospiraceae bacterium]|nr:hypothetical protein [Lachnospiraceae bacterium]